MILTWEKPKQLQPTQKHNDSFSADGAPPGVYVPNMSKEDMLKWKARYIGGANPRVEIRKTAGPAQVKIIVSSDSTITLTMNSAATFAFEEFLELDEAVREARLVLSVEMEKK